MADDYKGYSSLTSQGESWVRATPHDTNEIAKKPKALYVHGTGSLTLVGEDDVEETFPVDRGMLDLRPKIIKAAGTDVTVTLIY